MLPSQRRFTVFCVIVAVGIVAFFAYDAITANMEWYIALAFSLVSILVLGFRFGYWMMRIEEWELRKAAKKSGQKPT